MREGEKGMDLWRLNATPPPPPKKKKIWDVEPVVIQSLPP